MKNFCCLFLTLITFSTCLYANESNYSPRTYLNLVFEPGLTMRSGAENIISFHNGLSRWEDQLIGTRWFVEKGVVKKAGGIGLRFAKLVFIDQPIDIFTVVFTHEYFGHGARYRSQDWDKVEYSFDAPAPYGPSGGAASGGRSVRGAA